MNSTNPQEFEPSLGERVTRLEVQVAAMRAELKGAIDAAVAELKGMIGALSARIDAQNARLDDQARRLDEQARRMDSLEAHMRKMNTTIILTGISVALSVIFGVGAINSSLVSGMTAAFQAGDGSARWRTSVERNIDTLQKDVGVLQKDVGELKQKFTEMEARQMQQGEQLHEIRKLLERRAAAPEPVRR
jgi:septal ring factor EnvC (AmiA/AmiB activator)